MATLQAQRLPSSSPAASIPRHRKVSARLYAPKNLIRIKGVHAPLPQLPPMIPMEELCTKREENFTAAEKDNDSVAMLYVIAEAAADRAEMHNIIGEQRNNWNVLLLNSINVINLSASLMAGVAAIPVTEAASPHILAFKLSSALLFTAATGMMLLTNKIQPSQLAEEQRNATRLFKQLERSIQTTLALRAPTRLDVEEAMQRVLALDKAYPLPLLSGMLDKFPKTVEPTVWWPRLQRRPHATHQQKARIFGKRNNGWSEELEEEMRGVLRVLKAKDEEQYVSWGTLLLNINRNLALSGPLLAGLAALGASSIGLPGLGQWPAATAVVGGALATVVNALEHGGQVGMVFEMFRNCAGFYRQLEEEIESNLGETEVESREDGEMFEMKLALQLGRSLSELKGFASYASPSCEDEDIQGYAGKLF